MINLLIFERRNVNLSGAVSTVKPAVDFRSMMADLDGDIYEAAFPPPIFKVTVANEFAAGLEMARAEPFHYYLFYRLTCPTLSIRQLLEELMRLSQERRQAAIALVTYNAGLTQLARYSVFERAGAEALLPPVRAVWEAWDLSLKAPGVILSSLQDMQKLAEMIKMMTKDWNRFYSAQGLVYEHEQGFIKSAENLPRKSGDEKSEKRGWFFGR